MRFVAVVLVAAIVVGGVLGFVIQQRAAQSPKLSAPTVIAAEPKTPTKVETSKTGEAAGVSPKSPLLPQPSVTPDALKPVAGSSPATPQSAEPRPKVQESPVRIDEANYVQVSITPISLRDSANMISFEVSLNTHSVDLSRYQLDRLARLIIDGQTPVAEGFQWVANLDDSHHRSGVLKLPAIDAQGKERVNNATKTMILELDGVAGSGIRSFSWDAPASLLK